MADERKGLLLVAMILLVGLTTGQVNQDGQDGIPEIVAVEDSKVTLPCGSGRVESEFVMRQWVRGFMNTSTRGEETLFTQTPDTTIKNTSRDDLSLEKTSFNLTIGEARLEDTSIFTCFIEATGRAYYIYIQLTVHVTSKLVMRVKPNHGSASVHDSFTVSCDFDRVYPPLPNDTFIIDFKGERYTSNVYYYKQKNKDGTYNYMTYTDMRAEKSVNGEEIACHVRPQYGEPQTASKVLTVYYAPEGKPAIHTDHRQVYIGDKLLLQCAHGTVVNGNPRFYTYCWFLDDLLLRDETRDLSFTASSESAGNYSCEFKNSEGFTSRSDDLILQVLANQPLENGALWNSLSKDGRTKLKDEEINMNEDLRRLKLEDVEKMNLRLEDKNLVLHHLGQMNGNEASIYDEVEANT